MMNSRRDFLRSTALGATAVTVLPRLLANPDSLPATAPAAVDGTAKSVLLRNHRNLFNGDTSVYFSNPERWQPVSFVTGSR